MMFTGYYEQYELYFNNIINDKELKALHIISHVLENRVGLNLNFKFESAHELLMNLNLKIKNKTNGSNQCRR